MHCLCDSIVRQPCRPYHGSQGTDTQSITSALPGVWTGRGAQRLGLGPAKPWPLLRWRKRRTTEARVCVTKSYPLYVTKTPSGNSAWLIKRTVPPHLLRPPVVHTALLAMSEGLGSRKRQRDGGWPQTVTPTGVVAPMLSDGAQFLLVCPSPSQTRHQPRTMKPNIHSNIRVTRQDS